jgi:putative transposase
MLVFEFKVKATVKQQQAIDEAIRIGQFIRNKCLKLWMDSSPEDKVNGMTLNKYTKVLADDFNYPWVCTLNSMARQASVQRAWFSISRFYNNCKKSIPGKKGYPKFKKFSRSVEYKTCGWKLSEDQKYLTITDKTGIGKLKLIGSRSLSFYDRDLIKRVRLIKRADGYYVQFCLNIDRTEILESTGSEVGIDVGLAAFYTDSKGNKVENPRYLRKSEKRLRKQQRRLSKRHKKGKKQSKRYHKQRHKVAKIHLKISRQRKDFAVKTAKALVHSNDVVVYEELKVKTWSKTVD